MIHISTPCRVAIAALATATTTVGFATPSPAQTAQSVFSNSADFASFELALFDDVVNSYWAKPFIDGLLDQEILEGFPNGDFRPNDPITWGQFAAMMSQAFDDATPVRNLNGFPRINANHWSYQSLQSLYQMGFNFPAINPDQTLTRLELLSLFVNGFGLEPSGGTNVVNIYSDINTVPAEYRELLAAATSSGLMVSYPDARTLNLSQVATRADTAVMLYQALVKFDRVSAITSPYLVDVTTIEVDQTEVNSTTENSTSPQRQNCNQGIGNGSEGCDPGNSQPHGGSNDEGGHTPGNQR
ncbi:MAG: S-layer homology domain-containing protein [Spirulina sp. SIO3F2]|nr:S-layer homology domain-containing protein [Spirulina sp. SIO3F2]